MKAFGRVCLLLAGLLVFLPFGLRFVSQSILCGAVPGFGFGVTWVEKKDTCSGGGCRLHQNSSKSAPWRLFDDFEHERRDAVEEADHAASMPDEEDWLLSRPPYDREAHYNLHGQLIPKHLHKVILTRTGKFSEPVTGFLNSMNNDTLKGIVPPPAGQPGRLPFAHRSWKAKNPNYEIRYFNLHCCRAYLKQFFHPLFLRVFDCIEAFAGKTNLFRTLVVYREGGFYSDWKQECMKDGLLDLLSEDNTTWFSAWDKGLPAQWKAMQNSFFGATPQSPILAEAIRIILRNAQSRLDLDPDPQISAYHMTGTVVLGKAFRSGGGGQSGVRLGVYQSAWGMRFMYGNEAIIVHKCYGCGQHQNWAEGNNYLEKRKMGEYFCPDAPSLFT